MNFSQPSGLAKVDLIQKTFGAPSEPGKLGVVLAFAGVGKTACLTHIALEYLLQGRPVLHVSIGETPEKIKVWYQEFMRNMALAQPQTDIAKLQQRIEPLRFILAYLHHTFSPEKLEQSLQNLESQADFHPAAIILDGLDFDQMPRSAVESLREFAEKHQISMWMSAKMHRHISTANEHGIPYPCNETDDLFDTILLMQPTASGNIEVKVIKYGDRYQPELPAATLNSQTFFLE